MAALTQKGPRPSDRWIPWYFVAFFVGLTLLLAHFVWLAVNSYPGTVGPRAYEQGLAHNKTLAAAAAQATLGWQGTMVVTPLAAPHQVLVQYQLRDASGAPLKGAAVKGWFYRPSDSNLDQKFALQLTGDDFSATLTLPANGAWELRLSASADGKNFQQSQRFVLP